MGARKKLRFSGFLHKKVANLKSPWLSFYDASVIIYCLLGERVMEAQKR